jgi:hypothetical protein
LPGVEIAGGCGVESRGPGEKGPLQLRFLLLQETVFSLLSQVRIQNLISTRRNGLKTEREMDISSPNFARLGPPKIYPSRRYFVKALAGEAPRFEKGKGSGAKEDPSPASIKLL